MKNTKRVFCLILLVLLTGVLLSGCLLGTIRESKSSSKLSQCDPMAGLTQTVSATLFYKYEFEDYLATYQTVVSILGNERTEAALLRELFNSAPSGFVNCFSENTSVIEIIEDNSVLYVTVSKEFIDVDSNVNNSSTVLQLRTNSVINTLCTYKPDCRVQLLVDTDNNGTGQRLTFDRFGYIGKTSLIEPMVYSPDLVLTPEKTLERFFDRLVEKDFTKAFSFISENEISPSQKPTIAAFIRNTSIISEYICIEVRSCTRTLETATILCNFTVKYISGETKTFSDMKLLMNNNNGVYKINYNSFVRVFNLGEMQ